MVFAVCRILSCGGIASINNFTHKTNERRWSWGNSVKKEVCQQREMFEEHVIPNCNLKHQQQTQKKNENYFFKHKIFSREIEEMRMNYEKVVVDHNTQRGSHWSQPTTSTISFNSFTFFLYFCVWFLTNIHE